jgi:signal transduction histidine kinase
MKKILIAFLLLFVVFVSASCNNNQKEYFNLWNDCVAITKLKEYVSDVTNEKSKNYIPVEDRIATFDMDGTFIGELYPTYFEYNLLEYRALDDPTYQNKEASVVEAGQNIRDFVRNGIPLPSGFDMIHARAAAKAYAGMSLKEFDDYFNFKLESGDDISIERFDVAKLIKDVIKNSSILLKDNEANIIFDDDKEHYVWADSFQVEEVITNYLTNAIHYVKEDGKIKVWIDEKGDVLRINVYNDGDNISEEDLKKVFIKFYKTDPARTREYGGSGIGLSIVAAIMQSHNKDYGVYNAEKGVVFFFEVDTQSIV